MWQSALVWARRLIDLIGPGAPRTPPTIERDRAEPPWMSLARAELGTAALPGPASNARVAAYYRDAGFADVKGDEVAWCAAFACAVLERAGTKSPRSLRARDFLDWGVPLTSPRPGCLVVLWRGEPGGTAGHVGFYAGEDGTAVRLLGGNQGNRVSIAGFARGRVLGYRWPAKMPARKQPPDPQFEAALAHVLAQEGGWSDDPFDPGGPTYKGITLGEYAAFRDQPLSSETYARLRAELRALDVATITRLYRRNYWDPARCPELPAPLALMHFDTAVNQGVGAAARLLQMSVGAAIDGEIGPLTLTAARVADPAASLARYAEHRRSRYRGSTRFWRFGRGWLARVDRTLAAALTLAEPEPTKPATTQPSAKETPPMQPAANANVPAPTKWWGQSMTIWGAMLTALTTVLPAIAQVFGIDLPAQLLKDLVGHFGALVQAICGIAGIVMTIVGRVRASTRLDRRELLLRL
jgi:uncharacterized protein (TIGR02594 family)